MKTTLHKVKHYFQPTNSSCGYAALAILLSHYGFKDSPETLIEKTNIHNRDRAPGESSVTAQLAAWVAGQGFDVNFYSFDSQITDYSWSNMSQEQILERLHKVKNVRNVAAVGGKEWSKIYVQAYIDLINNGGKLIIQPFVTTKLLYDLLKSGPIFANISSTTLRGNGRQKMTGLRKSETDDIHGITSTHSLVIYGNDMAGNFLVSDPWVGLLHIEPETMVIAITAAQIECDNQVFVILPAR